MPDDGVPIWDGDPASFETFCTSCRWYAHGLKESERKLAAPRVWQKLHGAAKSVVRHLDPKEFDRDGGLDRLLEILRSSPLQKLPIPDSFQRLERWSQLRRGQSETIPTLLVREEELFTDLQNSLQRARLERHKIEKTSTGVGARQRDPSESPSRSPMGAAGLPPEDEEEDPTSTSSPTATTGNGFFENELRGYRLLKASKLSHAEKQHVMTLTRNSTHFTLVRQALRSLFAEGEGEDGGRLVKKHVWYADEEPENWTWEENEWHDDGWSYDAYWTDWSDWQTSEESWTWEDSEEAYYAQSPQHAGEDGQAPPGEVPEEERRLEEAFALANEANRTLSEAKQAVARVRQARGYYDGTGTKGGPKGSKGGKSKGKSKNKGAQGPCFACGQMGHGIANCPDRHAPQGKSMSPSSKGFSKGKGKSKKGKGKGKTYYVEYEYIPDGVNEINVLSLVENEDLDTMATSWVVLETGAAESVAGVNSMTRIMQTYDDRDYRITLHERPTFRFGNGMTQRAISRIHLKSKALGEVAFYLLDGTASNTPPLLGSKDMRERKAVISYTMNYMAHQNAWTGQWWLSDLRSLPAGHLLLDLQRPCKPLFRALRDLQVPFNAFDGGGNDDHDDDDDHDGGNGPAGAYGGPGKRSRSSRNDQNEISRLVEITALAAERADDPLPSPSPGRDEELDEAGGEVPDLPHEEPILGVTLDSREPTEHPEDETSHHNDADDQTVSSESCEVLRVRRPFNDEASRSKDSRSSERPLNDSDFEESVNMVWHANDSPWSEHQHGDEPRLSDRLSILAQRLQGLQQRLRDDERQAMPTFDRLGSKADGMAMHGQSLPREGEIEQGGSLAVMHSMRSTTPRAPTQGTAGQLDHQWIRWRWPRSSCRRSTMEAR